MALILILATSAFSLGGYLILRKLFRAKVRERTGQPPLDPNREWIDETRKSEGETTPPLSPPKVPQQLVEALMQHQAMLCVGSGLSVAAGIPSLQQVTLSVARAFESELTKGMKSTIVKLAGAAGPFSASDASPLIEALVGRVGRSRVDNEIRRLVSGKAADLTMHRRLANLPWHGIVSLTWDDVMYRAALANNSGEPVRILPQDVEQLRKAISDNSPFIVDAFSAAGDLVLTPSDFERQLDRYPAYARQLALLLDTDQFLFIGISPQTLVTYLRAFGRGVRDDTERHLALVPFHSSNEIFQATLSEFGVALLEYDPTWGDAELVDFIKRLEGVFEARTRESDATPRRPGAKLEKIRIERLKLSNIGPFRDIVLEISDQIHLESGGQWTVILGPNGGGKSILLRSIALALVANEESARSAAAAMLTWGAQEGSIDLGLGRLTITTEFYVDRGEVEIRRTSRSTPVEAGYALVIGFPALRGAPGADPKSFRQLSSSAPKPSDLVPLIYGGIDPRMAEIKQWIFNVLKSAKGDAESKEASIKTLLDSIVSELVPGNFRGFADFDENDGICLERADGVKVPLFSVSSGMSSIFNWVGVVIQRLYDVYPNSQAPNEEWAVVLIDEIDVHLHPDWQRRLVELVKRFFPNLQVLATTHSPLIASSLRREEVRVLQLDGSINAPKMETYGCSADEIMQSDVGGLRNARPLAVEKKIVEYDQLYAKVDRNTRESERMIELRDELGLSASTEKTSKIELPNEEELADIMRKYKR
ncbi:AAA family ATPase [Rhizobium laguerreae]|uniref:AAA family ATPase n=1 Tax=Rhizobium laguerreae TaxID=1076926 RepID=UPI001C90A53A|nr:AAA family ATPase [Rhizobium laguerreae]MBY3300465.1 AAA family ATPase [Rhizobium laguerreae]